MLADSFRLISQLEYLILTASIVDDTDSESEEQSEQDPDQDTSEEDSETSTKKSTGSSTTDHDNKTGSETGSEKRMEDGVCHLNFVLERRMTKSNEVRIRYGLPDLKAWQHYTINCPKEHVSTYSSNTFLESGPPFLGMDHPKVYFLEFDVSNTASFGFTISFAMHIEDFEPSNHMVRLLLACAKTLGQEEFDDLQAYMEGEPAEMIIPFSKWGIEGTRIFLRRKTWQYHHLRICGYRVLASNRLYDFNPLDIARDKCRHGPYKMGLVLDESWHDYLDLPDSKLPYRSVEHNVDTANIWAYIDAYSIFGFLRRSINVYR